MRGGATVLSVGSDANVGRQDLETWSCTMAEKAAIGCSDDDNGGSAGLAWWS